MNDAIDIAALRESFRAVLAAECSLDIALRHFEHGHGILASLWGTVTELGWPALAIPETHGGLGLGLDALAALYEELGRAVAPLPFLSTMLAAQAIAGGTGEAAQSEWLPRIAAGAIAAVSPPAPLETPSLRIARNGDRWRLSGQASIVDAADAQLLLLLAADASGALYRIAMAPGDMDTAPLWDHGHTLSRMTFNDLPVPDESMFPATSALEEQLALHASLALAAEAVGGRDAILRLTIEYLKTRHQFGKPIGSFQGLKHRVADHRMRLEGDRMLLASAVQLAVVGDPLAASEASAAKAMACGNYVELARDCIQLHGGIGFTSEQACHLFLKRARLNEALFGGCECHLARASRGLDLEIAA